MEATLSTMSSALTLIFYLLNFNSKEKDEMSRKRNSKKICLYVKPVLLFSWRDTCRILAAKK